MGIIIVTFLNVLLWSTEYINEHICLTFFKKHPANGKFYITVSYDNKKVEEDADIIHPTVGNTVLQKFIICELKGVYTKQLEKL